MEGENETLFHVKIHLLLNFPLLFFISLIPGSTQIKSDVRVLIRKTVFLIHTNTDDYLAGYPENKISIFRLDIFDLSDMLLLFMAQKQI